MPTDLRGYLASGIASREPHLETEEIWRRSQMIKKRRHWSIISLTVLLVTVAGSLAINNWAGRDQSPEQNLSLAAFMEESESELECKSYSHTAQFVTSVAGFESPKEALAASLQFNNVPLKEEDFTTSSDSNSSVVAFYEKGRTRAVIVVYESGDEWLMDSAAFCNGLRK